MERVTLGEEIEAVEGVHLAQRAACGATSVRRARVEPGVTGQERDRDQS